MKKILITLYCLCMLSCSNHIIYYRGTVGKFQFFKLKDSIQITVTRFYKNNVTCYTEAIPYALIIGTVNNNKKYPNVISILAICDNNTYKLGEHLKISQSNDERIGSSSLSPLNFTRDTIIGNQKSFVLIGSEHPAVWANVTR